MTSRERILETLAHRIPDWVPVEMWFNNDSWVHYTKMLGTKNLNDYFNMDVRRVYFQPQPTEDKISYSYPFPDREFALCKKSDLDKKVGLIQGKGLAVIGHAGSLCFETATSTIGGLEKCMIALAENDSLLINLLDKITDFKIGMMEEYAKAGVDVIHIGDDFGSQHGLLISPVMLREWFKPRILRAIDAVRQIKPDVAIFFHSDGNIEEIIPDFIEIGVDIINPVQPECMDIVKLKGKYGDSIIFWGGIGTQSTMPFGTVEEVKKEVGKLIDIVGRSGGLVICPSHMVQMSTPLENIIAFFEAVKEFGAYRKDL